MSTKRLWVRRVGFAWRAINPDETLATIDTHTGVWGWTREQAIRRATKRFYGPSRNPYEEVEVLGSDT